MRAIAEASEGRQPCISGGVTLPQQLLMLTV